MKLVGCRPRVGSGWKSTSKIKQSSIDQVHVTMFTKSNQRQQKIQSIFNPALTKKNQNPSKHLFFPGSAQDDVEQRRHLWLWWSTKATRPISLVAMLSWTYSLPHISFHLTMASKSTECKCDMSLMRRGTTYYEAASSMPWPRQQPHVRFPLAVVRAANLQARPCRHHCCTSFCKAQTPLLQLLVLLHRE